MSEWTKLKLSALFGILTALGIFAFVINLLYYLKLVYL